MKLIFADESLIDQLLLIAAGDGGGLLWKTFENDFSPDASKVFADYTFSDDAWGEIQVPPGDFTLQQLSAHQASIQADNIVITNGSGGVKVLYGYAITNEAGTKIVASTRFDAPIVLADGASFPITPVLGSQSLYES